MASKGTSGLKVLLVAMNYAPELSGTAPYTTAWATDMARRHHVVALTGPPHYPEWRIHDGFGRWRQDSVIDDVFVRRLRHFVPAKTSTVGRIVHETTFAARVLAQRTGRPDVVVAISPPLFGAAAASRIAHRFRVPFGVVVQDIYSEGVRELGSDSPKANRAAEAMRRLESRVLRSANAILTIHDQFATTLRVRHGARPEDITIVGNWAHIPPATKARADQRASMGWGGDEYVVLHAGNMGAKQGLENVVEAARLADTQNLPLRYVLMGDGNQRPSLERAAMGVRRIQFLPSSDSSTYADILAAADLLLVNERPGVAEMSLPSKLTSYCAAGRPILAATGGTGATAAVVTASGAGLVVPPGEPATLNEAVLTLSEDPAGGAELGRRGKTHACTHQGEANALTGYDCWLKQLVQIGRSH